MQQLGRVCLLVLIAIAPGAAAGVPGTVAPHALASSAGLPGSFLDNFSHLTGDDMSPLWHHVSPDAPLVMSKAFLSAAGPNAPEAGRVPVSEQNAPRGNAAVRSIGAVAAAWPVGMPPGQAPAVAAAAAARIPSLQPTTTVSLAADFPSWEAIRALRSVPVRQDGGGVSGELAGQGPVRTAQARSSVQAWRLPKFPEPNSGMLALCALVVIAFIVRKKLQLPA